MAVIARSICAGASAGSVTISEATVTFVEDVAVGLRGRRSVVEQDRFLAARAGGPWSLGLAEMTATGTRSTNEPAAQFRALNVPTPYCTQAAPMPLKRA